MRLYFKSCVTRDKAHSRARKTRGGRYSEREREREKERESERERERERGKTSEASKQTGE